MNNLKNQGVASVKFSMSITLVNLEKLERFSYKYWRNSGGAPKDLLCIVPTHQRKIIFQNSKVHLSGPLRFKSNRFLKYKYLNNNNKLNSNRGLCRRYSRSTRYRTRISRLANLWHNRHNDKSSPEIRIIPWSNK